MAPLLAGESRELRPSTSPLNLENRCPGAATALEVTDYAFPPAKSNFSADTAARVTGNDDRGPPARASPAFCGRSMLPRRIRPDGDGVIGEALNHATAASHRVGFVRGFITDRPPRDYPGEYSLAAANNSDGSLAFSILC